MNETLRGYVTKDLLILPTDIPRHFLEYAENIVGSVGDAMGNVENTDHDRLHLHKALICLRDEARTNGGKYGNVIVPFVNRNDARNKIFPVIQAMMGIKPEHRPNLVILACDVLPENIEHEVLRYQGNPDPLNAIEVTVQFVGSVTS